MNPDRIASVILAFLLLVLVPWQPAHAQGYLGKPHNDLRFPIETPVDVEVHLTQRDLEYQRLVYRGIGLSPLGDALAAARLEKKETEHIDPAMAALTATPGNLGAANLLAQALREALAEVPGLTLGEMTVYDADHPPPPANAPPADRMVLLVRGYYSMLPMFSGFRVELQAVYGQRSRALSEDPKVRNKTAFLQRVFHDVGTAAPGMWTDPETTVPHWQQVGIERIREHAAEGLRETARMLAYELQRRPRTGRIPGKQYGWVDGPIINYGALETRRDGRAWLRVRNGHLVSVPESQL